MAVELKNLETGETIEVSDEESAQSLLDSNDNLVMNEGKEKTVDPEIEKLQEDESDDGGEFVAKARPGGLEAGEHKGTIVDMETKEVDVGKGQTATYLDLHIDVPEGNASGSTRVGFPFNITLRSQLGKLLKRFGTEIEVDKSYDVKKILLNEPITFYVVEDEEGYSNVKKDTIMPAN